MRSPLAIVALCAFVAVDAATDYQMGCIKKVRSMISEFVSVSQMKALSSLATNTVASGKSIMDVQSQMTSAVMDGMTTEQYGIAMNLYFEAQNVFGSLDEMKGVAMQCISAVLPLIKTKYNELNKQLAAAKKAKKSVSTKKTIILKYVYTQLNSPFPKKVALACRNAINDSDWAKFKSVVGTGLIKFDALGI